MTLSEEREASGSLIQSQHSIGCLLGYLLAPRTGNCHYEEVVSRVLQENYERHERMKQQSASSLCKYTNWRAKLLEEMDTLSKSMEVARGWKAQKEIEEKISVLHMALNKVEASITKYEDLLEESWIQEDGDWGQPDSHEASDEEVRMEPSEESNPPDVESSSHLSTLEMETSMEVGLEGTSPEASGGNITISSEEDDILSGDQTHPKDQNPTSDTASVPGEMVTCPLSSTPGA